MRVNDLPSSDIYVLSFGMLKKQEKMVAVLVRIPAELHASVKAKAEAEERTMAQTIRHALRRYVGR